MVASTSIIPSRNAQKSLIEYYRSVQSLQNITRIEQRTRLERVDRSYQREQDLTDEQQKAKRANRQGDSSRFQNMEVPVVMPQVEAAVTHQTSVFLTGYPLFGVVSSPEFIDEALQMQSIFEDNSTRGGWARELILFFRDGQKYNFAPIEVDWGNEVTYSVETNTAINLKEGTPKEVIWSGNRIKRLDPYNTFVDTRVPPSEVYKKGEFAGYVEIMTRIELKSFISELPDKIVANIVPAFESGIGGGGGTPGATDASSMSYYTPSINPDVSEQDLVGGGTNWLRWAGLPKIIEGKIDYKDSYEVSTLYCKILPSEHDLQVPNKNTPQIYKLIIVNHEWIIYAELQTNAHAYLPILIGQPLEDGLGYQTKSLAANGEDFQNLASAYMNSVIASRRRAISDRVLFDPSRITSAAINSPNPSAKIPVRPAAYGKDISQSVYAFPYREDQAATSMQQVSIIMELANQLNGQNRTDQGQFTKGNRTLEEFDTVMQNADGRDQLASILLEHQVFVPMKLILKLNTLQFQGGTTIYNRDKQISVEIDPVALRKAVLEFTVSDGLIPTNKIINAKSFQVAMQVFGSSPQIAAGYNQTEMFSYMMKTQGAEISEFEKSPEQIAYEQALGSWQSIMQLAIEKGIDPATLNTGPQPLPEQFNYDPKANKPTPAEARNAPPALPDNSPQAGPQ